MGKFGRKRQETAAFGTDFGQDLVNFWQPFSMRIRAIQQNSWSMLSSTKVTPFRHLQITDPVQRALRMDRANYQFFVGAVRTDLPS